MKIVDNLPMCSCREYVIYGAETTEEDIWAHKRIVDIWFCHNCQKERMWYVRDGHLTRKMETNYVTDSDCSNLDDDSDDLDDLDDE